MRRGEETDRKGGRGEGRSGREEGKGEERGEKKGRKEEEEEERRESKGRREWEGERRRGEKSSLENTLFHGQFHSRWPEWSARERSATRSPNGKPYGQLIHKSWQIHSSPQLLV